MPVTLLFDYEDKLYLYSGSTALFLLLLWYMKPINLLFLDFGTGRIRSVSYYKYILYVTYLINYYGEYVILTYFLVFSK